MDYNEIRKKRKSNNEIGRMKNVGSKNSSIRFIFLALAVVVALALFAYILVLIIK